MVLLGNISDPFLPIYVECDVPNCFSRKPRSLILIFH